MRHLAKEGRERKRKGERAARNGRVDGRGKEDFEKGGNGDGEKAESESDMVSSEPTRLPNMPKMLP